MTGQEEGTVDTENEGYVLFANAIHNKHSIQSFVRKYPIACFLIHPTTHSPITQTTVGF